MATKLERPFYARPAVDVARDLLGKVLIRKLPDGEVRGRIVEAEAYAGQTDPGSHAFRGLTARTRVMFGPAGYLYVYFTYGMHFCMNVVTDGEGVAGAVLLRAVEPLDGIDMMETMRGPRPVVELCNGPAKLCQAFGIAREHNGLDLQGDELWIEDDGRRPDAVGVSVRVGLSAGQDLPYRFYVADNPFVSIGRPLTGYNSRAPAVI